MSNTAKTIELRLERAIAAPAGEVFDAWLNPKVRGNPWNMAEKLILDAMGFAEHIGTRIDSHRDLREERERHLNDSGAFRPP